MHSQVCPIRILSGEWAGIPFAHNHKIDPLDNPQESEFGVVSHYNALKMISLPIAATSKWTYRSRISSQYFIQSEFFYKCRYNADLLDHWKKFPLKPWLDRLCNWVFKKYYISCIWCDALFPPLSRRPESLVSVDWYSSKNNREAHCCLVWETYTLGQQKQP